MNKITLICFCLVISVAMPVFPENRNQKPNIVFILIDDLGWSDLPAYGNKFAETPNIDQLVKDGTRFTNAYAAAPVCSPTRASIMSGQYPARVGVTDFIPGHWRPYEKLRATINKTQYLPLECVTIAERLKEAGYTTGYYGKWHLGDSTRYPDKQGFDSMLVHGSSRHFKIANRLYPRRKVDSTVYLADYLTDRSIDFIGANKDRPFFLMLAHYAVHIPLEAKKELIKKYEAKPKPDTGVNNPIYAAMLQSVDESVGRILQKLKESGLTENTMVVFFSDNGGLTQTFDFSDGITATTNDPLKIGKGTLYEGGIRVPMIVKWPGKVKASSVSDCVVSSVDLYPTFLFTAGLKENKDHHLDGNNLEEVLTKNKSCEDRAIYWHYPVYHHASPASAVRKGQFKLIEIYDGNKLELYNLKDDIGEAHDLSATMPEKVKELSGLLSEWKKSVNAELPVPNPDFDEQKRGKWGKHPSQVKGGH